MNFCNKCGGQLNPGASFCPACGAVAPSMATPQQYQPQPQPQPAPLPVSAADASGFIASLVDLSFTAFITPKLVKVLYVLGVGGAALWALVMAGTGIRQGGVGYLFVLVCPILFLVGVIYMRVMMEMIMVVFRAADHLAEIARQGRESGR